MAYRWTPHETPRWRLEEGVRLSQVVLPGGRIWEVDVNFGPVESITVQMENGQMAPVPFARVLLRDRRVELVNLATVESVIFAEPFPADESESEEVPE